MTSVSKLEPDYIYARDQPIMLIFLPIMLCCSAHKIYPLCSRIRIVLYIQICINKSLLIAENLETVLLGCIYRWQQNNVLFDNDCSIRVYQSLCCIFSNYAGIMLHAFSDLLAMLNIILA